MQTSASMISLLLCKVDILFQCQINWNEFHLFFLQGSFSFQRCLPSGWILLIISGAITLFSEAMFLDRNNFWQTMLIHLAVGVVCFAISTAVMYVLTPLVISSIIVYALTPLLLFCWCISCCSAISVATLFSRMWILCSKATNYVSFSDISQQISSWKAFHHEYYSDP